MILSTRVAALTGPDRAVDAEIALAAKALGATPAPGNVPGLWNAPGYPEITTGQLLSCAAALKARGL